MRDYSIEEFSQVLRNNAFSDGRPREMTPAKGGVITVNITALTDQEKALARAAFLEWEAITSLDFVEVTGKAKITYSHAGDRAHTVTSYDKADILSARIEISAGRVKPGDGVGSYVFRTYMHETAHALGLDHPQDYGDFVSFKESSQIANDSWQMSLMSYLDQNENTAIDATKANNLTPMAADYMAIRAAYGAVPVREGNTVYGVGSTAGGALDQAVKLGATVTFLIADTGGIDTISFAGFKAAQKIDLNARAISNVMGGIGNMQIAHDTTIENATGGLGADLIIGNGMANRIEGGGGADTLRGGAGDDIYVTDGGDRIEEVAKGGVDTVLSSADHVLAAEVEHLTLTGAAQRGTGNALANTITGNGGANLIDGGGGADRLIGGAGDDVYRIDGRDTVVEARAGGIDRMEGAMSFRLTAEVENGTLTGTADAGLSGNALANRLDGNRGNNVIDGGAGDDVILGQSGNDTLSGGAGADTLTGGAGDDVFVFGKGDTIVEVARGGTDRVEATITIRLTDHVENAVLTGSSNVHAYGNDGANLLTGNAGRNLLSGGEGNDRLIGGAGADRFVFSAGHDRVEDFSDNLDEIAFDKAALGLNAAGDIWKSAVQVGNDVVFGFGADKLVVIGATLAQLADDVVLI